MQHWNKVTIEGDKPFHRYYHDTCCVTGPSTSPLLMVVGGYHYEEVVHDVLLLDVDKWVWSEVSLLFSDYTASNL